VLDSDERRAFAIAMLRDILDTMEPTRFDPQVVATATLPDSVSVPHTIDDRSLDAAITAEIDANAPLAVVMADLPLLTPDTLARLRNTPGDVVLVPGRGGGTNAMMVRDAAFETDYHGASIRDHREIARERGLSVGEVDSFRLGTDVDEPEDLLDVLLHSNGRSAEWLEAAGFRITESAGRPTVSRAGDSD
jgi:2-phospho-L-lactate guanylyltransferase